MESTILAKLRESKSAPLYHGTTYENAYNILKSNVLRANTANETETHGVSFTRNKDEWYSKFVFVVDQAKLVHNYKVGPVYRDGVAGLDLAEERVPRDIKNFNRYILRVDVRDHPIEVRIRKKKIAQMTREDLVKEPSNAVLSGLHFLYKAIELCKSKGIKMGRAMQEADRLFQELVKG